MLLLIIEALSVCRLHQRATSSRFIDDIPGVRLNVIKGVGPLSNDIKLGEMPFYMFLPNIAAQLKFFNQAESENTKVSLWNNRSLKNAWNP